MLHSIMLSDMDAFVLVPTSFGKHKVFIAILIVFDYVNSPTSTNKAIENINNSCLPVMNIETKLVTISIRYSLGLENITNPKCQDLIIIYTYLH